MKNPTLKRSLLLALLLMAAVPAAAQWRVGIQAGYTRNTLDTDMGYAYDWRYNPRGGFTVGVPVSYGFRDWLALRAELSWGQKNYKMHRTGLYDGLYTNTRNSYLQLPLMAEFSFGGRRVKGLFDVGGYVGWWAAGHREGISYRYFGDNSEVAIGPGNSSPFDEKYVFDSRRDNRFDAGLAFGVGVACRLTERVELQATLRYYYSLTDMQKQYMKFQTPRYNTTLALQLGCVVILGRNK